MHAPLIVAEHLGKLHGYEHLLVLLLAFGPILLLAVTIRIARRRNRDEEDQASRDSPDSQDVRS